MATASVKSVATYGVRVGGDERAGRQEFGEMQLAARERIRLAGRKLGAGLAVVIDVCGLDEWAGDRLATLRAALDALADHYGFPRPSL